MAVSCKVVPKSLSYLPYTTTVTVQLLHCNPHPSPISEPKPGLDPNLNPNSAQGYSLYSFASLMILHCGGDSAVEDKFTIVRDVNLSLALSLIWGVMAVEYNIQPCAK